MSEETRPRWIPLEKIGLSEESKKALFEAIGDLPDFESLLPLKFPVPTHAVLDTEHRVVPARSLREWAEWFEKTGNRRVAETSLNGYWISTVFLGINHGFYGPPLWFETMVFPEGEEPIVPELGGKLREHLNDMQLRYATYAEAKEGHEAIVEMIRCGLF